MRYQLSDSVRLIPGIGPKVVEHLAAMEITMVSDLLHWFPRRYIDGSHPILLTAARFGEMSAFRLTVDRVEEGRTRNRNLKVLRVFCSDDSGEVSVQWFNQPYLKTKLQPGTSWIMIGAVQWFQGGRSLNSPLIEARPVILPVYSQTHSVTSKMLRTYLSAVLSNLELQESLPSDLENAALDLSYLEALQRVHIPTSMDDVLAAQQALAFREVWDYFMQMEAGKEERSGTRGEIIPLNLAQLRNIVERFPFTLTAHQKRAIWDMLQELASGTLMTRLLNGDVGSGKTVVAGTLAAMVARSGFQSVLLAPTEILAVQHFTTLRTLLGDTVSLGLWTGSTKQADGEQTDIIVGTHALLYDTIELSRLRLIVIDEQHRFGVRQRAVLREGQSVAPHVLSMTATPIPRTLALTLFADLEVAFLKGKPAGRQEVVTQLVRTASERARMEGCIADELSQGHQVFVVCPAIVAAQSEGVSGEALELFGEEDRLASAKKAVEAEAERLRREHPEYGEIVALHGKMRPKEKAAIMEAVHGGRIQVLVATTVIEVGVDIPNATVLVVEGAEHFGLAQLHQLRGRIGRGTAASYCFLCPSSASQSALERLRVLVDTNDGFAVAEADLAERGPGDLQGMNQSGLPDFRMVRLSDIDFLQSVRQALTSYLKNHPNYVQEWSGKSYSISKSGLE